MCVRVCMYAFVLHAKCVLSVADLSCPFLLAVSAVRSFDGDVDCVMVYVGCL